MKRMWQILMTKNVKYHIGFHYLLTEIQLHTSILLELNKSITLNIFIIQDNHSLRCGFYCVAFIEYKIAGKILLDYLNLFSQNDYKKNEKKNNYFKDKYAKPQVYINKKTDEARNYVIEEIKHNDLMNERFKKTCKYLNYVEHLLILASTVTSCVSISAFSS